MSSIMVERRPLETQRPDSSAASDEIGAISELHAPRLRFLSGAARSASGSLSGATPVFVSSVASIDSLASERFARLSRFLKDAARGLSSLVDDSSEDAEPIDPEVMHAVVGYLASISSSVDRAPKFYPLADGGISLQWNLLRGIAVIEFDTEGDQTVLIRNGGGRRTGTLEVMKDEIAGAVTS